MPFMLYERAPAARGTDYKYIKKISIGGRHGPLARFARQQNPQQTVPFQWHISEKELIKMASASEEYVLVIDLKPNVKRNISLFQLKDIWGYSYKEWTVIMIRLETLFIDVEHEEPAKFKQRFNDYNIKRTDIFEFLYLQGGVKKGTWNWGMIGFVNGALLWPDALTHFVGILNKVLNP